MLYTFLHRLKCNHWADGESRRAVWIIPHGVKHTKMVGFSECHPLPSSALQRCCCIGHGSYHTSDSVSNITDSSGGSFQVTHNSLGLSLGAPAQMLLLSATRLWALGRCTLLSRAACPVAVPAGTYRPAWIGVYGRTEWRSSLAAKPVRNLAMHLGMEANNERSSPRKGRGGGGGGGVAAQRLPGRSASDECGHLSSKQGCKVTEASAFWATVCCPCKAATVSKSHEAFPAIQ